jgi:tRNA nucleotidyltransferase (CCA-adding enzyme)
MLAFTPRYLSYRRISFLPSIRKSSIAKKKIMEFQVHCEEEELFRTIRRVIKEENLGTTVRVAGGWVRDRLLGLSGKNDIDLALDNISGSAFAETLAGWYGKNGKGTLKYHIVNLNPDKSKHLETATMQLGKFDVDMVQLRTDKYTEGSRIPQVDYGTPLEDALRRDLTINSLFYNIHTKTVEDCTGRGLEDLASGVICTPLPALVTLQDDPLRAFRAVRFACRFNFSVSPELEAACRDPAVHTAVLNKVSAERISQEMHQMLDHPTGASRAMLLLHRLNLLQCVLPVPPALALEVAENVDFSALGEGSVMGSARGGPHSLFGLENVNQNAVNLVVASHLLSPLSPGGGQELSETQKRERRLLR